MNFTNSSCSMFNGDLYKCNVISVVRKTTASLSLAGSLFMIFIIWLFSKYKLQSQRLIFYLSVSSACYATVVLVGSRTPSIGFRCTTEGFLLNYFGWTVLLWVSFITFDLYINIIRQKDTNQFEKFYHLVAWLLPLIVSVLPLQGGYYGPAGVWCWIVHDALPWRFGLWYAPLFAIIVAMFFAYTYIYIVVRRRVTGWHDNQQPEVGRGLQNHFNNLRFYPCIYLALSFSPFALRVYDIFANNQSFELWLLTVLTVPLQGAANAVCFGFDPMTRSRLTFNQIFKALRNRFCRASREYQPSPAGGANRRRITVQQSFYDDYRQA